MEKKDKSLEEQLEREEDLLDLSLDDLTPEDAGQEAPESESEEEIIELVDLVKEGKRTEDKGDVELEELLVEEGSDEEELEIEEGPTREMPEMGVMSAQETLDDPATDEVDVSDISLELDMSEIGKLESVPKVEEEELPVSELEKMLEEEPGEWEETALEVEAAAPGGELREEIDLDVEVGAPEEEVREEIDLDMDAGVPEEVATEEVELAVKAGVPEEEVREEIDLDMDAGVPEEEVIEEVPARVDYPEPERRFTEPSLNDSLRISIGVSEDKLEAIITKAVEDIVERVTRETMSNVAERVIREAIDELKESIESTSN